MLPKWIYLDSEMMFCSHYEASETVGGDLFDRIRLSDTKYVVYIGDISGHGVQAALLMTAIRSIIRLMVETEGDSLELPRFVTRLNERLCHELFINNNYLTLLIGVIDLERNEFHFLNAGHPPLIAIDILTGKPEIIDSKGSLPMGWRVEMEYKEEDTGRLPIGENKIILLFTDGIYECVNPENKQFGLDGLMEVLSSHIPVDSCVSLPFQINSYLQLNNYQVSSDDFTLFAFQKQKMQLNPKQITSTVEAQALHYMITLRAALKEVGKTSQQCESMISQWTGNPLLAARAELIVDEFLNNIIKYGYNFSEDSAIVVEFMIHDNRLKIKFWDKGIEWAPELEEYSLANPYDFNRNLYEETGKGVKIIMSMTSKFHRTRYDQLNETVVEIEL